MCSFTACLWLSGEVPSAVPSLQFGRCCVRTDCKVSVWDALHSLVGRGPGEVCGGVLALLCALTYVCYFVKPLGVLILERSNFIK